MHEEMYQCNNCCVMARSESKSSLRFCEHFLRCKLDLTRMARRTRCVYVYVYMHVFNEYVCRTLDFSLFAAHHCIVVVVMKRTNRFAYFPSKHKKNTSKYIFAANVVFKIYRLQNGDKRLSYFKRHIYDFQAHIRINCIIFSIKLLLEYILNFSFFFKFEFDKIRLRSAYKRHLPSFKLMKVCIRTFHLFYVCVTYHVLHVRYTFIGPE